MHDRKIMSPANSFIQHTPLTEILQLGGRNKYLEIENVSVDR